MKIKTLFALLIICPVFWLLSCNSAINPLGSKETPELFPIYQGGKTGYINRSGEVIIQPQFTYASYFSEGLAAVCLNKCGYIDKSGNYAINPQFDFTARFSEGLAAVGTGQKIGFIDKSGKYVINPQFELEDRRLRLYFFSEGLARVRSGGKIGFIDKTGKYVINPQFEEAWAFFDGLAAVKIGDKWGYVDKEGKIVINPQFENAQPFVNELAAVSIGKQYGYIDKTGKIVINPQFGLAIPFSDEGLALVTLEDKIGFIDKTGKYIINPQFLLQDWFWANSLEISSGLNRSSFSEGLAPISVSKDNAGYIDTTGKIVINPQFVMTEPFYGGLASVVTEQGRAYIDKEGKYVWRETRETPKSASNSSMTNVNATNTAVVVNMNTTSNTTSTTTGNTNLSQTSSQRTGRLTTDSNLRSEPNKDSASLGIHFKGAKVVILDETSFTNDKGELSTWYRIRVTEHGCSVNANLGCGKNTPNDAEEGWVNAKVVLLD